MEDLAVLSGDSNSENDAAEGEIAAQQIWDDREGVDDIADPRTPAFATAVVVGLAKALASSPGAIKKMMRSAASAAEDLNVEPFQGLIEVIQNADDLSASEVRFAFRGEGAAQQLLIVHNGKPVACQHVLGMALPFLTTKTNRTDQRGRFGIGLKTLKRIAVGLAIHSAPYHFSGDQLSLGVVDAEDELPGFYDPARDTLIVLNLKEGFDQGELKAWFDTWDDDGLIFLSSVSSFRWCTIAGETIDGRTLAFSTWQDVPLVLNDGPLTFLSRRDVGGSDQSWTVWRAALSVPAHLHPAHKARSETTYISIAAPRDEARGSLYIGFKTRVPVGLSFSVDAQFDPSTAREALIENDWNNWLIARCGNVIVEIASGLLLTAPSAAWRFVPLSAEQIGTDDDRWLRNHFAASFTAARLKIGERAAIGLPDGPVRLPMLAYEAEELTELLTVPDIEALAESKSALPGAVRDAGGRWRTVLDEIGVSTLIDSGDLLAGFNGALFKDKSPAWWVKAARIFVEHHPDEELFDAPIWLSDDGHTLVCLPNGKTDKPLVLGAEFSPFGARWKLLNRLHPAYGYEADGSSVVAWLSKNAAFRTSIDAEIELAAFAERFRGEKLEIDDADLRELRNRFDELSDRRAEQLGRRVGEVLLLDGFVYKAGKVHRQKVKPSEAYLCKTLDSDFPYWPLAAGSQPGIQWIAARYDVELKTGATRQMRKRADGTISRGARKFLMLLGAETAPRLKETGVIRWGGPTRMRELKSASAEQVPQDYTSPDLQSVIASFKRLPKKELKVRSPALLKALSRAWDRIYASKKTVASEHVARVYTYARPHVTADWLLKLRESEWISIGKGELVAPASAVIKTFETQTLYANSAFAVDIELADLGSDIATSLGLVTSVRVSDLTALLRNLRDGPKSVDEAQIMQIYRNISKHIPKVISWNTKIGDLTAQELRRQFAEGSGLVLVGGKIWRRPSELLRGKDIFHDRTRFVPGGSTYTALWAALDVREPSLDDCLPFLKQLASGDYDGLATACLIDVYRYMEPLLESAERRHRERLKTLPLFCGDGWKADRPIFLVEDQELRTQLGKALPNTRFWVPPCDLRDLPMLVALTGVTPSSPALSVREDREAALDRGDGVRMHFVQAVDHLANELARNDPDTRQRMSLGWDGLREIPLLIYSGPIAVQAEDSALSSLKIAIELQALVSSSPPELHAWEDALPKREFGGHAIASFFPPTSRRGIEAEWVVAWQEARDKAAAAIRLASDEEHADAMRERTEKLNAAPKKKIAVSAPIGKGANVKPRTLKENVGLILGATINLGSPPRPAPPAAKPKLHATAPAVTQTDPSSRPAPTAYTLADLEQRGWELLVQALETSADETLVDFRNRHGVGADGAINWKTFVEMKATGRAPQGSIEMSNAEYQRAKERGTDFILALVSGLEDGYQDEIRLIFDPANRASVRPVNGVKLVALSEAPAIVLRFGKFEDDIGS